MATAQPKLVHKQFNSPIGLYSQENVKETFNRDLMALGGQGIEVDEHISKPLNLANSAVLRALAEEEHEQNCGYKRVAWPPIVEDKIPREFTPQPQTQFQPHQLHQYNQQPQLTPSAGGAVPNQNQVYRAPSASVGYQQPPHQQQHQQHQQPPHSLAPQYNSHNKEQQPPPPYSNLVASGGQQKSQPGGGYYQIPQQQQHQYQQQNQLSQQEYYQQSEKPPEYQYNNYYSQPREQTPQQQYRGESPGVITLRKEVPITQEPSPVYSSQPATASYRGGSNMRGDLKWPPPEYKEQAALENEDRLKLAKGPVCRPRRVKKDYTQFFAKNALNSYYPSYRVPPGTQHMIN